MGTLAMSSVLEATARDLLDRHLQRAREWYPHEMVPWAQGSGDPAPPEDDPVRSALLVNLLTEDNLPHYFHSVISAFRPDSAMAEWARRWAAEEQRHSIVLRDWISVTRQLDLMALEKARMIQVTTGFDPGIRAGSTCDGMIYLALQELATRVSYRNTAAQTRDPDGVAIMARVAADENLHFLFYRDMATAAMAEDPSAGMVALDRQVTNFAMPGAGIGGFGPHAAAIAGAGIYDFAVHHHQILDPLVRRHWKADQVVGLDSEGAAAQEHLVRWLVRMERVAGRIDAQRADAQDSDPGGGDRRPPGAQTAAEPQPAPSPA